MTLAMRRRGWFAGAAIAGLLTGGCASLAEQLRAALRTSSYDKAERLISDGADVNRGNRYGETPLHEAAEKDDLRASRLLIAHGADVNARDKHGRTPLMTAIESRRFHLGSSVTRLLVSKGADLNASDQLGRTPLMYAAEEAWPDVVDILVAAGAQLHTPTKHGVTLLEAAARQVSDHAGQRQQDSFAALVFNGADTKALATSSPDRDRSSDELLSALVTDVRRLQSSIGTRDVPRLIYVDLDSSSPYLSGKAAEALVAIGEGAVEPLLRAMNHPELDRSLLAWVLGEIGDKRAVPSLLESFVAVRGELEVGERVDEHDRRVRQRLGKVFGQATRIPGGIAAIHESFVSIEVDERYSPHAGRSGFHYTVLPDPIPSPLGSPRPPTPRFRSFFRDSGGVFVGATVRYEVCVGAQALEKITGLNHGCNQRRWRKALQAKPSRR